MSILTRLPDIIASAAGVLFQEYTIRRFAGRTSDGRGGFTPTWETYVVKGQVTEYSDEMRYLRSIPEDARKLIIQGKNIPQVPQAEDYVAIEGASWKIISVDTVPSNAVYECEVHPDTSDWGIDLATTTSTTPAILQDLETTVSAVGNLLFEDLQFFYLNRYADDGRGGNVRVLGAIDVRGLVTEYSERMRAIGGFQPTDRQVIIQGKDLAIEPGPGDIVRFGSEYFVLTNVRSVPGKAVYEARGRPTTADAATLPTITADAIQTMDDFTASSVGEIVAIVGDASALLEPFTASGFGQFTIEGDASAQMDHFTGDGFAWVTEVGVVVNQVEDFTCSSDATLPISADAAATLDNFVSPDAQADLDIEGDGGAVMDDFTGSSLALLHIEADASGALEDFTGASSASQQNQGNADVTLDHFTGAGEGDPLITGDQSTQVVDFTSVSVAENPIEANASQTLEAFTSVADAVLAIEASSVAVVADFMGSGSGGQGDLEATAAATLVNFTGSSDATLPIEADASATLDAFVGTAIGEPILEGQHGGVMDDFTSSSAGTNDIEGEAGATLDAFTSTSTGEQTADAPPKAETTALLNAMVNTQTAARQDAIDDLMAVMVDEGIFALLDWFCIVGADDDACLRNWIDPTQTLVQTNNAQLVHDSYFDTKSNPSGKGAFVAEAVNLTGATLGDLTFGNYFVKLDETGSTRASRLRDNQTYYRCDFSAPIQYLTGTNMGNSYASRVVNDPYHMTMVHRGTGAADREGYYQGVSYFTGDGSGGSLTTTTTIDLIGTAAKDSDERVLCGYFGRALSSAQVLSLHNAIEAYKTAIGA